MTPGKKEIDIFILKHNGKYVTLPPFDLNLRETPRGLEAVVRGEPYSIEHLEHIPEGIQECLEKGKKAYEQRNSGQEFEYFVHVLRKIPICTVLAMHDNGNVHFLFRKGLQERTPRSGEIPDYFEAKDRGVRRDYYETRVWNDRNLRAKFIEQHPDLKNAPMRFVFYSLDVKE